jgi:integrase
MPKRPRFPLYPRKMHGSGQARIKIGGKDVYLGLHGSPESWVEYQRLLTAWNAAGGAHFTDTSKVPLTVREVIDRFLAWCKLHRAEATYAGYKHHCNSFAQRHGHWLAVDARVHQVNGWVDEALGENRWNGTTAFNARRSVFRAFQWAADEQLIPTNPLKGMKRPRPTPDRRALTDAEYKALIHAAGPELRYLLIALRHTGARPKELRTCIWPEVQVDRIVQTKHKTSSTDRRRRDRVIWLTPVMQRFFGWLKKRPTGGVSASRPCGYQLPSPGEIGNTANIHVFTNSRNRPWSTSALVQAVEAARKRAGLAGDVCAYSCRHTFATQALLNGVSASNVAILLGNSVQMIEAVYSHVADEHDFLKAEMEKAASPRKAGVQKPKLGSAEEV